MRQSRPSSRFCVLWLCLLATGAGARERVPEEIVRAAIEVAWANVAASQATMEICSLPIFCNSFHHQDVI